MVIFLDGKYVVVFVFIGGVVYVLDVVMGEEVGCFLFGDLLYENIYFEDGECIFYVVIGQVFMLLDWGWVVKCFIKGECLFQIVDVEIFEIIKCFDLCEKLDEVGYIDLSLVIWLMVYIDDECYFYFQVLFFYGFLEYDMQEDCIICLVYLFNLVFNLFCEKYVNDFVYYGIVLSGDQSILCVVGIMSDYVVIVFREIFEYIIFIGIGEKFYWVIISGDGEYCYIFWSGIDQMFVFFYESGQEVVWLDVGDYL